MNGVLDGHDEGLGLIIVEAVGVVDARSRVKV